MKVIFIKDLKKQGHINEVKEVSDGYAVNFLIKNGYAVKYTKTSSSILHNDLVQKEKEEQKDIEEAKRLKEQIENMTLKFTVKSNNGKVFGSVSSKMIHDELLKKGIDIPKRAIKIDGTLSSLGSYIVKIDLHKKVSCDLVVQLVEK